MTDVSNSGSKNPKLKPGVKHIRCGVMVEVHAEPQKARSDALQQMDHEQFDGWLKQLGI